MLFRHDRKTGRAGQHRRGGAQSSAQNLADRLNAALTSTALADEPHAAGRPGTAAVGEHPPETYAASGGPPTSRPGGDGPDAPAAPPGGVAIVVIDGTPFAIVAVPGATVTLGEVAYVRAASGPATAVVVDASEATAPPGGLSPPFGVLDVTFEVTRADGSGYREVMRIPCATPRSRDLLSTEGTEVRVRMDPRNQRVLAIDITSLS